MTFPLSSTATIMSLCFPRLTRRVTLGSPTTWLAMRMSLIPAAAIASASPSLAHVMPMAPAVSCLWAMMGHLWVFSWGLSSAGTPRIYFAIVSMFLSRASRSIRRAGVSSSLIWASNPTMVRSIYSVGFCLNASRGVSHCTQLWPHSTQVYLSTDLSCLTPACSPWVSRTVL